MSDSPDIYGSEEGWRAASTDSRRHQKHKDIKTFIDRQIAGQEEVKRAHEDRFFDDLVEAAGPVVYAGLERKGSTTGYGRSYAANYDRWLASLKGD